MSVTAVCPGSFDPVTYGHLDVIERAASRFDALLIGCLQNERKQAMFTIQERVDLLNDVTAHLGNVTVATFTGLLVDFCRDNDVRVVVKGLRAVSDFEYELQMAQMNQRMGDVETMFLTTSPEYSYLSSSLIKEIARFGGPLVGVVPDIVRDALRDRFDVAER